MNTLDMMQILAVDWGTKCFGAAHMTNRRLRAIRLLEEAVELAQACDVEPETVSRLIEVVYSRPKGEPEQELGGVAITATVMADALGSDLHGLLWRELRRCLSKSPEHFKQRNDEKLGLGLK